MNVAVNSRGDLEDIESRQLRQATCFTVQPTVERGETTATSKPGCLAEGSSHEHHDESLKAYLAPTGLVSEPRGDLTCRGESPPPL